MPTFSVVIPVYNGTDFLHEAIDSVLSQTCNDYELLVINDGSTDNGATEKVVLSYGQKIRYFIKPNGGTASALNFGLKQMKGDWFVWLSHDDFFSNNRLAEDLKIIQAHPEAKVTYCRLVIIDQSRNEIWKTKDEADILATPREVIAYPLMHMCTLSIHRSCFEQVGEFNEKNRTTQDMEMAYSLSKFFPFYCNKKAITYNRDHPSRGTYTLSDQHKIDLLYMSEFLHREFPFSVLFPQYIDTVSDETIDAWLWLGKFYKDWGCKKYMRECYHNALRIQGKITFRSFNKYLHMSRMLEYPLWNFFVNCAFTVINDFAKKGKKK